jgi:hypothetical protein
MSEEERKPTLFEELTGTVDQIIHEIKRLIKEGNARRLIIKNKEGKTVLELTLTAGVAGSALLGGMAPVASILGAFVMYLNEMDVIIEKYPETEEEEARANRDEYEVEGEVIDIEDGEDDEEDEEPSESESSEEPTSDDSKES